NRTTPPTAALAALIALSIASSSSVEPLPLAPKSRTLKVPPAARAGPGVTASAPVTTIARKATCFVISTNVASCSGRVKLSFRRTRTGYHGRSCKASDCRQCDCVTGWRRTLHRGSYNAVSVNGREGSDDAPDRTAAAVVGRPGAGRG